jgi:hypothetical protein
MILTVALLNGPFIACTTGKLPQQSQKLRKKLKIQYSIHRTVRYASSLACSFNQIIWGIKWSSRGLLKLKNLE